MESLLARALAAHQKAVAKRGAERQEHDRRERDREVAALKKEIKLRFDLDVEPVGDAAANVRVEIEGIAFRFIHLYYQSQLYAERPCPECGETMSWRVSALDDLGAFLSNRHECQRPPELEESTPRPPTAEERLICVLREWISEEVTNQSGRD